MPPRRPPEPIQAPKPPEAKKEMGCFALIMTFLTIGVAIYALLALKLALQR